MKNEKKGGFLKRHFSAVVFYSLLICFFVFVLAVIRLNVVKASYRISEAKIEKRKLIQLISNKKVAISSYLTPAKIEQLAKEKYKLRKPLPEQVVYFEEVE